MAGLVNLSGNLLCNMVPHPQRCFHELASVTVELWNHIFIENTAEKIAEGPLGQTGVRWSWRNTDSFRLNSSTELGAFHYYVAVGIHSVDLTVYQEMQIQ